MTINVASALPAFETLQQLLTGVLVVNGLGQCTFVNASAEQLLSASQSQIVQQSVFSLLTDREHTSDTIAQQFDHARQMAQTYRAHHRMIHGVRQPVLVDYSVTPVEREGETLFIVELWGKDRQSQIEQEQQLQTQHHVARQMIRNMAHEVKNPLAGILGASQLLQKNLASGLDDLPAAKSDKLSAYLGIIMDETRRLNALVTQLLGSHQRPQWQRVNVHEPLEHVIKLISLEHGDIIFKRDYDLSLPELVADKDALIQVFFNLINNAVFVLGEHQTTDPTITVRTRIAYQYTIGEIRHKQVLNIAIIDNGPGIDPQLLPQIFYPLVSGRANGTGLGLAVVQDIIRRHQGLITVDSKLGETVFHLFLPWQNQLIPTNNRNNEHKDLA